MNICPIKSNLQETNIEYLISVLVTFDIIWIHSSVKSNLQPYKITLRILSIVVYLVFVLKEYQFLRI